MPIAEFPAVISPESILRDGTGSFSERRATDGSHGRQIPPNLSGQLTIPTRHATIKSHRSQIPTESRRPPDAIGTPCDHTIAQQTDRPESRLKPNSIGTLCDLAVAPWVDIPESRLPPDAIGTPCDRRSTHQTDTTEPRRPGHSIRAQCDCKLPHQTDTSQIQHQTSDTGPPCDSKVTRQTDIPGYRQPGERYPYTMRPHNHTASRYPRPPAPDQRQSARRATTRSHRGRIGRFELPAGD